MKRPNSARDCTVRIVYPTVSWSRPPTTGLFNPATGRSDGKASPQWRRKGDLQMHDDSMTFGIFTHLVVRVVWVNATRVDLEDFNGDLP
jgi:hypothetical protein